MKGYFSLAMNNNLLIPTGSILRIEDKGEILGNSTFNFENQMKLVLNGNCFLSSMLTINADIDIGSSGLLTIYTNPSNTPKIYFAPNTGINCSGELNFNSNNINKVELLVDSSIDTCYWSGIKCENPQSILIDKTKIKKAKTGFSATDYISNIVIQNSDFQDNLFTDIKLDNSLTSDQANADINHCVFTGNSNLLSSIVTDDILNVQISYNQFNDIHSNGVSLLYTVNPILTNNNILGTTGNVSGVYTGIYSYSSAGFYGCNTATNFYDGILLDNSSPYMLNNELWNNGYGLYLTNNSIPIMSPSYSQNQALFNAGYNKIYNNLSDEIFCNNGGSYQLSYPYLTKGYNSIYDSAGSEYLLNLNYLFDPPLDVTENFWGGESAYIYDKISPQGSTVYDPYLGSPSISSNCSPYVESGDFGSLSSEMLLFGSANIDNYNKNYSSAENKYKQILSQPGNPYKAQKILPRLFSNMLLGNADFNNSETYFQSLVQAYPADTFLFKKSHHLTIGSIVEQPDYNEAIGLYNQIIQNSGYVVEKFYANIDKMRAIKLMLDTLMNNYSNIKGSDKLNVPENIIRELGINKTEIDTYIEKISSLSKSGNVNEMNNTIFQMKEPLKADNLNGKTVYEKERVISDFILKKLIQKVAYSNIPSKRPTNRIERRFEKKAGETDVLIPKKFDLYQNYPNPFNPVTNIKYAIPKNGLVSLRIYDVTGREIATLVNEYKQTGYYTISFNGSHLASGIYFYRLQVEGGKTFSSVKKMVLIK
ncbi:MAG TPA: T9SS type A sorting domain-containing protein [Ignavibacteria bacterium]|nr:T9SS type A sorting domain-containing protein [Ignavibacteria bacterium]